jgi:putative nucleotidyltransferase with HDIG domain
MQNRKIDSALRSEEQRTLIWFISLFYIIAVSYDIFYYFIRPYLLGKDIGFTSPFHIWIYFVMFLIITLFFYLTKINRTQIIKYLLASTYLILNFINDCITFYGTDLEYASGNIAEMYIILFAPIFVSSRFYWFVSLGTILKYLLLAVVLKSVVILIPIILVLVLALISYILLNRFKGYVAAVKHSYDHQLIGIVKGVIATLELKDPYTRGHSERVAEYAQALAIETGQFSKEELIAFNYACLLHDIGKIHIPDAILMKPTQLTGEEYEIIKSHPVVGADAVADVEGLENHINVIRSHHERWDGRGYPDQLQGEDIPILARVVAVADAFDAMTSSRSYRSALSIEEAYSRIIEGKGTQFDPELVEVFERTFVKWTKIYNKYQ